MTSLKASINLLIIAYLIIVPFQANCSEPHYTNGFKYSDQKHNEKAIETLKKNDIPIIISDDGYITYPDSHKEKANQVLKVLDNRPYSEFYAKKYADNFSKLLSENNIKFDIKILSEKQVQVYWNHEDDKLVRELKKQNLKRIFEK